MLLNLIKLVKLHTSINLRIAFANVLEKFGKKDRISVLKIS